MKTFIHIYGRGVLWLLTLILLAAAGCLWFGREWSRYGIAEDGARAGFSVETDSREKPVLSALSHRLQQGEKIPVKELASAIDRQGRDYSDFLCFYDRDGRKLSGYFPTQRPGIYRTEVELSVPDEGWYSRRSFTILVDGRLR